MRSSASLTNGALSPLTISKKLSRRRCRNSDSLSKKLIVSEFHVCETRHRSPPWLGAVECADTYTA